MAPREPFSYTNSKGVTYYLNEKAVTLRGGKEQVIRFFSKDIREDTAMYELPDNLAVQENPRNGFLTVKLLEVDSPSCEDDDDCDCCAEETVEQESKYCPACDSRSLLDEDKKSASQYRRIFGRDEELIQCDGECCAPKCREDLGCCCETTENTENIQREDKAFAEAAAYKLMAALKEAEATKAVRPTMRRCLVEEIKSFAQNERGNVGESNTVVVSYEYDERSKVSDFNDVTPPTSAYIRENRSLFSDRGERYNREELAAHIKNLQTILNTLV